MLDTRTSRWTAATLAVCVALLAATWFLVIAPRRSQAGSLRGQAVTTESQAEAMRVQLNVLRAQFGDLKKQRAKLARIQRQLPSSAQMPQLVRDLQSMAASSGVSLDSVKPGAPVLSKNNSSVVEIPMSLAVKGDYFEDVLFVKHLQTTLDRSFLITGLTVADSDTSGSSSDSSSSGSSSSGSATPTAAPTAAPTGTPAASAPAAPVAAAKKSMTLSGSIFVLLNGSNSLGSVTKQAQQAAAGAASGTVNS